MKTLILILFCLIIVSSSAQRISPSVISSAGGYDENAYAKISWTLGETVTETETNGEYIMTQGFQQGHFNIISVQENPLPGYTVNVYPNPFTNQVFINITTPDNIAVHLYLYDATGRIIKQCENIAEENFVFDGLSEFSSGIYFLKAISAGPDYHKIFKIEKTGY